MRMADYVAEIDHALEGFVQSVWAEHKELEGLRAEVERKTRDTEEGYRRAEGWLSEEQPGDYMLGVGLHWENYFGPDKERHAAAQAATEAEQRLLVRQFSRAAVAGSILQLAKQGVSIIHGELAQAPDGRLVGTQPLKNVIWQARNQALHWEDHSFGKAVDECFELLAREVSGDFGDYRNRNLAFEVVQALGWTTKEAVEADLQLLA